MLFLTGGMVVLEQGFIEGTKFINNNKVLPFLFHVFKGQPKFFLDPMSRPFLC